MEQLVFVYGTLRQGERNHYLIDSAKLVTRQAWLKGKLIDTGKDYPALLLGSNDRVYGEIYEVNNELLKTLDELEGFTGQGKKNHYERCEQVISSDLGEFKALVYFYPKEVSDSPVVPFGDWRLKKLLDQGTPLYFAYGSCMDYERIELAGKIAEFKTLGLGSLHDYELQFTVRADDGGRADIVETPGQHVQGIVYDITDQALEYLYEREGVYIGKYRPAVVDVEYNNRVLPMLTFIVIDKLDEVAPPDHYLNEILRGGKPHLSETYLKNIELRVNRLKVGN